MALSPAVQIAANTLCVVSYHTAGNYSADSDYLTLLPIRSGRSRRRQGLTASMPMGRTLSSPTNTFAGSNYYVDVVFNPGTGGGGPQPPVANNDSFSTAENAALPIAAAALLTNDTDPGGLALSVASVTSGSGGTASLSGSTVTFTPAANFTGLASFTYVIKNSAA